MDSTERPNQLSKWPPNGKQGEQTLRSLWKELQEKRLEIHQSGWLPEAKDTRPTPSTGRFPPTPTPNAAYSPQTPIQLLPPPTARPKTPAMKRVALKASRRPMMSEATPQKDAPIHNPVNMEQVVYRTCVLEGPNSDVKEGRVSATTFRFHQS